MSLKCNYRNSTSVEMANSTSVDPHQTAPWDVTAKLQIKGYLDASFCHFVIFISKPIL